jgi:aryl-alcohol dehydrogenase-like predicted oxidoreductase
LRRLGRTGFQVTELGFGANQLTPEDPRSTAALARCVAAGVNLVDTARIYKQGQSEVAVGGMLAGRADVIVVSKCGYRPDRSYSLAPDFVAAELETSLAALGRCDVYLLHNPEELLDRGTPQDELYPIVARALAVLEAAAARGRIGWYGVSSNGFSEPAGAPLHVSLERVHAAAGPRFGVIELPLNLIETGAIAATLPLAERLDLGVLAHRALTAHAGETPVKLWGGDPAGDARLARLDAELPETLRALPAARKAMAFARDAAGVTSLLVGVRQPTHVDDLLAALAAPRLAVTPGMI